MIVVADTTPLNYLILIDEVHLLPILFEQVLVPSAALEEFQHEKTSLKVRQWMMHPPHWFAVHTVAQVSRPALLRLDPGEREAIQLALDLKIPTVLMDEAEGRKVAQSFSLEVRGTLGILEQAAKLGETDLRHAFSKLKETNFRMSPALTAAILKRNL